MNLWLGIGTLEKFPVPALLGNERGYAFVLNTYFYGIGGRATFDKTPVWVISDSLCDVVRNAPLGSLLQVEARVRTIVSSHGYRPNLVARSITILAGPKGSAIPRSKAKTNHSTTAKRLRENLAAGLPDLPTITLKEDE